MYLHDTTWHVRHVSVCPINFVDGQTQVVSTDNVVFVAAFEASKFFVLSLLLLNSFSLLVF